MTLEECFLPELKERGFEMLELELPELIEVVENCSVCDGKGEVVDDFPRRVNRPGEEQMMNCANCFAVGELVKEICHICLKSEFECNCFDGEEINA